MLFGCDLPGEYASISGAFGLDDDALAAIERTAIGAAFLDDEARQRLFG